MCSPDGRAAAVLLAALGALGAALAGCSRTPAPPEAAAVTAPSAPAPVGEAEETDGGPAGDGAAGGAGRATPWPALVRDEQWDGAWRALEALSEPARSQPEVRYVRARVALARGDAAAALPLLEGLDAALPLLTDDIAKRRHEAMLTAGPFAEAGAWFAARAPAASQLDAARAFEKAKDARRARTAVEHVLAADKHTRAQEAEARAVRARLADPAG
ncbi:MAG TPA: hypothetical protein VHS09_13770, partial [Polyangiaceae bacterium]|nr:hypothetical protein [Polyangiaceae bacterium]